ncbi:MAG TPA: hypothetical protein VF618_22110 [Thermoanaerobaculia bacterium]
MLAARFISSRDHEQLLTPAIYFSGFDFRVFCPASAVTVFTARTAANHAALPLIPGFDDRAVFFRVRRSFSKIRTAANQAGFAVIPAGLPHP